MEKIPKGHNFQVKTIVFWQRFGCGITQYNQIPVILFGFQLRNSSDYLFISEDTPASQQWSDSQTKAGRSTPSGAGAETPVHLQHSCAQGAECSKPVSPNKLWLCKWVHLWYCTNGMLAGTLAQRCTKPCQCKSAG